MRPAVLVALAALGAPAPCAQSVPPGDPAQTLSLIHI